MLHILGVTYALSQALQKKDQDILNVISLVESTKQQLQKFRENGLCSLLKDVYLFCESHKIEMLNMEEDYVDPKNRRRKTSITNQHHYEFVCFDTVVDMQIQEFGDRFNVVSSELLICMVALNPHDSFCVFDPSKLLRLSEFYPDGYDYMERRALAHQLHLYINNVQQDTRFANLKGISDLGKIMVETKKHKAFPLVYQMVKLALVLPVATTTVERRFSTMTLVNSDLRNQISDGFLNDCVICAIDKEGIVTVMNEDVINRFQKLRNRREQL